MIGSRKSSATKLEIFCLFVNEGDGKAEPSWMPADGMPASAAESKCKNKQIAKKHIIKTSLNRHHLVNIRGKKYSIKLEESIPNSIEASVIV